MRICSLSNHAMTLIELIVASILVGIVTLGLIAAEQAIRMSRQSSNRDSQISAQLQAAMTALSKDINSTVGDASDTGIYQYAVGNNLSVCFRYAQGDPNIYSDDRWSCWTANTDTDSGLLSACRNLALPTSDCRLSLAPTKIDWATLTFDGTYTTFFSVLDDSAAVIAPASAIITGRKISYIDIQLKSRFNPAVASHPIENPEYTLTSRFSPVGLSR